MKAPPAFDCVVLKKLRWNRLDASFGRGTLSGILMGTSKNGTTKFAVYIYIYPSKTEISKQNIQIIYIYICMYIYTHNIVIYIYMYLGGLPWSFGFLQTETQPEQHIDRLVIHGLKGELLMGPGAGAVA